MLGQDQRSAGPQSKRLCRRIGDPDAAGVSGGVVPHMIERAASRHRDQLEAGRHGPTGLNGDHRRHDRRAETAHVSRDAADGGTSPAIALDTGGRHAHFESGCQRRQIAELGLQ